MESETTSKEEIVFDPHQISSRHLLFCSECKAYSSPTDSLPTFLTSHNLVLPFLSCFTAHDKKTS